MNDCSLSSSQKRSPQWSHRQTINIRRLVCQRNPAGFQLNACNKPRKELKSHLKVNLSRKSCWFPVKCLQQAKEKNWNWERYYNSPFKSSGLQCIGTMWNKKNMDRFHSHHFSHFLMSTRRDYASGQATTHRCRHLELRYSRFLVRPSFSVHLEISSPKLNMI